ncbi:F-box/LRR-repeat protein [Actinidia chinensis var. chinensis]|uniref:F-box/LRR-repeat protein n=1 Tax=Actinidia chinensis var. chinensis TaxID=1590841 RepID=A0A2R6R710_ACTCC|nr:F-box/LRR-repeat protein [Actinidia chinensis var. chinensis]
MGKRKREGKKYRQPVNGQTRSVSESSLEDCKIAVGDFISQLPEDILSSIVSLLALREAARTSILSKIWRCLWRSSLNLNFDIKNMTGDDVCLPRNRDTALQQQEQCRFVGWVYKVLKQHASKKIESCRVVYPLSEENHRDIDQWLELVAAKEVQELDIHLYTPKVFHHKYKLYEFPYWIFSQAGRGSSLKYLSLNLGALVPPRSFGSFSSLVSLAIKYTVLSEENVENILSNSLCLEQFSVSHCYCPTRLKFGNGHTYLNLRHLNIIACYDLEEVEICGAIYLASFECTGAILRRLSFKNSAQPVRLCFCPVRDAVAGIPYAFFDRLATDFPQPETMFLGFSRLKDDMIPKQLPTFTKLKELVLWIAGTFPRSLVKVISSLLKASPLLLKLQLHLPIISTETSNITQKKKVPLEKSFQHERLEEVEMFSFHGAQHEVELAIYLLSNMVVLRKMKIIRKTQKYEGDGRWSASKLPTKIKRKQVRKMLRGEVPQNAQLIVI